jgi:hypothetical protein
MRRQENYIILINTERARLRQWNKEVKPEKPEQLALSHLLLDVKLQEQGDLKGLLA